MEEMSKHGEIGRAACKADMDRKTARKYVKEGKLPSEMTMMRQWRTREDPFAEHWSEIEERLRQTPELEAKTLFELLQEKYPDRYEPGQLRTLQRRVRQWRAAQGPDKEVTLAQKHRPGVLTLPFSNRQWATVCLSESMAALRRGVQRALFQLGRVPRYHQTDNSTSATHRIPGGRGLMAAPAGKRPFNEEYLALMRHFGMTPRTTEVGAKEQNGDVEASNGAIKRRLLQALLVRGGRDFESVEAWQEFIDQVQRKANAARSASLSEELSSMRELNVARLPEFVEELVPVSEWSTIRVRRCAYSVPSRLMGETVSGCAASTGTASITGT